MKWTRAIDSAQRVITVERPDAPENPGLQKLALHIQGITVTEQGREWEDSWTAMSERGIGEEGEKPLSIWQRLKREEARVGYLAMEEGKRAVLTLWSRPRIKLQFNLQEEDEAALFRECEIMALSAGFHFRVTGGEAPYKAPAF